MVQWPWLREAGYGSHPHSRRYPIDMELTNDPTLVRVWRTQIDEARADEYERFARERSLPMFQSQDGFVGVFFVRDGGECAVITLWDSAAAAERLESSAVYRQTVSAITEAGFLVGTSSLETMGLHGMWIGDVKPEL